MKSENINRFKEVVFLTAFLILLFSFSNRAFNKIHNAEHKQELRVSSFTIKAVSPAQQIAVNNTYPGQTFSFLNFYTHPFTDINSKLDFKVSDLLKKQVLKKTPEICRLYYQFFTTPNEDYFV